MKLKLHSDFVCYADLAFDREGAIFRRMTTDGPSRPEMLALLDTLGYRTPPHGYLRDLIPGYKPPAHPSWATPGDFSESSIVVVYEDIIAHCGEGKHLERLGDARGGYFGPSVYGCMYIKGEKSRSRRELWVGSRCFRMTYKSDDPWRSNVGDVTISDFTEDLVAPRPATNAPLFAIDSVMDRLGVAYAVDYNIAPGVRGTGIEDFLSPREFVNELKSFLTALEEQRHAHAVQTSSP